MTVRHNAAKHGVALVDYDNLRRRYVSSAADVAVQAQRIIETLADFFRSVFPAIDELDVRLYGGWVDERGFLSPDALGLLSVLPRLRGRNHGMIVRPSLALTMMQFPDLVLRGAVRLLSGKARQKMVDGMLGCDAVFAVREGRASVGVVTDDADLIPAMLSAHVMNDRLMVWVRRQRFGAGLNDAALSDRGLRIYCLEEEHDG